jgi:hypothetical protein
MLASLFLGLPTAYLVFIDTECCCKAIELIIGGLLTVTKQQTNFPLKGTQRINLLDKISINTLYMHMRGVHSWAWKSAPITFIIEVSAPVRAVGTVGEGRVSALVQAARAMPACRHWLR